MHIIEWFTQNIIGKGAEFFLDVLRILWRVVGAINNFFEIGFWPSLVLISASYFIWNGICYYELVNTASSKESDEYIRRRKTFWKYAALLAILAALLLKSIYDGTGIVAGKAYLVASLLYLFVVLRIIIFIIELPGKYNAKRG